MRPGSSPWWKCRVAPRRARRPSNAASLSPRAASVWLALTAALAVAAAADLSAHRRDEQLQAARIAIEPDRVVVDLDVTPGADLAAAAIAGIDRDGSGTLSPAEQDAYAYAVAGALWLANDRKAHALRVIAATFPDLDAVRRGEGTIALRLEATFSRPAEGRHQLIFGNGHEPARSVFLANALVPRNARVAIAGQQRSATQHELTIDYDVAPPGGPLPIDPSLVLLACAVAVVPVAMRVRRG
jgi:hypothetical protein